MKKKFVCKVVIAISVFALFSGLFGCSGGKNYTADDLVLVSTAYYGTERDPVYSFALRKKHDIIQSKDIWFFSANCRVGEKKDHCTSFSFFPLPTDEADRFFTLIRDEGEIVRLRKYHNPLNFLRISDAPSRSSGMTFTDGSKIEKNTALGEKIIDYLFNLADRHFEAAESGTIKSVCITSSAMEYSGCYMFSIDKVEGIWFLSCDAVVDDDRICVGEEELQIGESDAEEILAAVKEQQLVGRVMQYEEPEDDGTFWLDETTYGTSFVFTDGSRVHAFVDHGEKLAEAFRCLVRKYK